MNVSDAAVTEAVKNNISIAGVLRTLGRAYVGTNYRFLRRKIAQLGLDSSHFKGVAHGTTSQETVPWDEILIANSPHHIGTQRKQRLIVEGYLRNECYACAIPPVWKGKLLTLILDHINGTRSDNSLGNLRLLCPNCNSQTETYCGRNGRKYGHRKPCPLCQKPILRKSRTCHPCRSSLHIQPTKIEWPDTDAVIAMVRASPITKVAEHLGVSDNAVRKFLKYRAGFTTKTLHQLRPRGREVDGGGL